MKERIYQRKLWFLHRARNGYYLLCLGLVGLCLIESVLLGVSFKHQRIILVPPVISKPLSVSEQSVSASYLSEFSEYLLNLRLNVSPDIVEGNYQRLFKQIIPAQYHAVQQSWLDEIKQVKAQQMSQVFYQEQLRVKPQALEVHVKGKLKRYIGDTKVLDKTVGYQLKFQLLHGRLWLFSLKEKDGD